MTGEPLGVGYLRIEPCPDLHNKNAANWYYDDSDNDETTTVLEIQKVYLIADQFGNVVQNCPTKDNEISTAYTNLGADPPAEIAVYLSRWVAAKLNTPGRTFWEK